MGETGNTMQFIANYDGWVSVKKLKIEPATEPRTIMEFLASLGTGIDAKVEANLRKTVELAKVDAVLAQVPAGKSEEQIAGVLKAMNSRAVTGAINEITALEKFQKNEQKELADFCRVYAMRKKLRECGLNIDYSSIEIPGMKKIKKAKV
ncbi:MAG: DUF2666 family protein [Candidatus Diapherotrites archaeon]